MPITLPGAAPAGAAEAGGDAPAVQIPFIRATTRHQEPAFDVTNLVAASATALGPFDVPAHGFVRSIVLLITGTGGVLSTDTIAPDFPYNILNNIELTDTNGFPLQFPVTGYQLYLENLFGAYRGFNDPAAAPSFVSGVTDLNPTLVLRIPVEITPQDGFGSLSNQNQSAPFRVRLTLASLGEIAIGGAATGPSVRVRGYLEAYSPVAGQDMLGQAQMQAPPGHGATQFWSVNSATVNSGQQQVRHPRVGNLIRNLIYVFRDASGDRDAAVEPDDFTITWDSRQMIVGNPNLVHRDQIFNSYGFAPPTGVLVLPFTDDQDGVAGFESRHLWLPTVQATRLELEGNFGAVGTVEMLTNDIAVTGLGR